jgi:hypothetical protein
VNGGEDGVGTPRDREGVPPGRLQRPDGSVTAGPGHSDPALERLGGLLRAEASRHRPDRERILALMAERERAESATPSTLSVLDERRRGRTPEDARRRGRRLRGDGGTRPDGVGRQPSPSGRRVGWPLVAASFAVLTMATVAGASVLVPDADPVAGPTVSTTVAATGHHTLGPAATATQPPATLGSAQPTTSATPSPPARTTVSGPTPSPRGSGQPAQGLQDAVTIGVSPTGDGTQLDLPRGAQDLDWIVVGSRQDGALVRAKEAGRPLGTVTVSGEGPSVGPGPYLISWGGGNPEQSRTMDTTWQAVPAATGRLRITVPMQGDRFTVELFAGTVKTTGLVSVSTSGSADTVTSPLQPCGRDACAHHVSVVVDSSRLPGGGRSGDLVIDLGAAWPGGGGGLGLAAVVLHP